MKERSIRKRLREKMLDRWENEGGKVRSEPSEAEGSSYLSLIPEKRYANANLRVAFERRKLS